MDVTAVLLVDCDEQLSETIRERVATVKCCYAENVSGVENALHRPSQDEIGLVLLHINSRDDREKASVLLQATSADAIPTVLLSELDDDELRLQMLNQGAVDCLCQPFDLARLGFLIDILTLKPRNARRRKRCLYPNAEGGCLSQISDFLMASPQMHDLVNGFCRVAPSGTTVLLTGETGCGKTHAARLIHQLSPRKDHPLMVISCGSMSPTLLASELFGHARGAFTGAEQDYSGKLAAAGRGTVLLDEIDAVPLESQANLLRVLEERVFEPLGETKLHAFQARVIAATNRKLDAEVAAGRFRADLYYRLNVVSFEIPPLRKRQEAILPLAVKFLESYSRTAQRTISGFSAAVTTALKNYQWPGNVRELRNVVERAVTLCDGQTVELADLPEAIQDCHADARPSAEPELVTSANKLAAARSGSERLRLCEALQQHNNNRTHAAAELGVSRVTLYKKMRQHGIV